MKKIDAFVDLENIGITFGVPTSNSKLAFIAKTLPEALKKVDIELTSVTCFASDARSIIKLPHKIKGNLREVVKPYSWKLIWSHRIADLALIDMVTERLVKNKISDGVLLVTDDHHFTSILQRVKKVGLTTIVCSVSGKTRLKNVADRSFDLWKLLGEDPSEICWEKLGSHRKATPQLNQIIFPDIKLT